MRFIVFVFVILLVSCDKKVPDIISGDSEIADLAFSKAKDGKQYADLILRALKTNRKQPIYDQLANRDDVSIVEFNRWISMYSTGISGRKDWEFRDLYVENKTEGETNVYDYAWLDPKGRLGLQIGIVPSKTDDGYRLDKIELRSRLDVMESVSIPGGAIDNYKKLNYNWDKK